MALVSGDSYKIRRHPLVEAECNLRVMAVAIMICPGTETSVRYQWQFSKLLRSVQNGRERRLSHHLEAREGSLAAIKRRSS